MTPASDDDEAARTGAPAPQPLPKAPRVNPPTAGQRRDQPLPAGAGGAEADLADLLQWARSIDGASAPAPEPAEPDAAQRTQIAREQRKFRKFDPEAAKASPAAEESVAGEAGEAGAPRTGEFQPAGPLAPHEPRSLRRSKSTRRGLLASLPAQALVVGLVAAGFFVGRATVRTPAPGRPAAVVPSAGQKAPELLSATGSGLIDQAMAAESGGDLKTASALLQDVARSEPHVAGLDYQLALLSYRQGDAAAGISLADRSIGEGENVADCYRLRAVIASQARNGRKDVPDFQTAAQLDPFEAKNFYAWGEALRLFGRSEEALVRLQQAIDRAKTVGERQGYELKLRLTLLELGRGQQFADKLAAEMARPAPVPYTLFAAAATAMAKGDDAAAAAVLDRLQTLIGQPEMTNTLRDYYFYGFAGKAALSRFFAGIKAAPGPVRAGPPAVADPFAKTGLSLGSRPPRAGLGLLPAAAATATP